MPYVLWLLLAIGSAHAERADFLRERLDQTLSKRTANKLVRYGMVTWEDFLDQYLSWGSKLFERIPTLGSAARTEILNSDRFHAVFLGTRLDPKNGRLEDMQLSDQTRRALESWDLRTRAEVEQFVQREGESALLEIYMIGKQGRTEVLRAIASPRPPCDHMIFGALED